MSSTLNPLPSSWGHAAPILVQKALSPSPVMTKASWVGLLALGLVGHCILPLDVVAAGGAIQTEDENVSCAGRYRQAVDRKFAHGCGLANGVKFDFAA